MGHKLAWYSLAPHFKCLRLIGSYRLDPKITPPLQYRLHRLCMRLTFLMPVIYSIQACVYIFKERNNVNKVIDSMFLFLSFTASMYKQLVLWIKADRMEELLDVLKGPSMNPDNDGHKKLLLSTAKKAKTTLYLFYCLSQATCITWVTFPVIVRLKGGSTEFAMWLPFDDERYFYGVLFYIWFQTSLLGINSSTTDVLLAYLLAQCKTQLSILRSDLETLIERSQKMVDNKSASFDKAFHRLFTSSIRHHNDIARLAIGIDKIFGDVVFYQFLVTGWIICTTAYRCINLPVQSLGSDASAVDGSFRFTASKCWNVIVPPLKILTSRYLRSNLVVIPVCTNAMMQSVFMGYLYLEPISVEFFSMILYLGCILTEALLFCYFGNELTFESEQLIDSAYEMDWLKLSVPQRRCILIFMERMKRPIQPLAGQIIPLSLSTFISIMRSSYTFYAFLKTTEEKQ